MSVVNISLILPLENARHRKFGQRTPAEWGKRDILTQEATDAACPGQEPMERHATYSP